MAGCTTLSGRSSSDRRQPSSDQRCASAQCNAEHLSPNAYCCPAETAVRADVSAQRSCRRHLRRHCCDAPSGAAYAPEAAAAAPAAEQRVSFDLLRRHLAGLLCAPSSVLDCLQQQRASSRTAAFEQHVLWQIARAGVGTHKRGAKLGGLLLWCVRVLGQSNRPPHGSCWRRPLAAG
jgi:hypothetical protein